MNKRIYFILLPLLALLFSFSGREEGSMVARSGGLTLYGASLQSHSSQSASLNRDNNNQKKNKIRIKAWDDNLAVAIAAPWVMPVRVYAVYKSPFGVYDVHFQSAYFSSAHLRGPPAFGV